MTKIEQLFIRGCKSNNSIQRVLRIYKRFYIHTTLEISYREISYILAKICDNNSLYNTVDFIKDVDNSNMFNYDPNAGTHYFYMRALINKIAVTKISNIEGYIVPAFFRNKVI